MDPMSMYSSMGQMMYPGPIPAYDPSGGYTGHESASASLKSSVSGDSSSSGATMNFNDYDDEFGNYYMRKSGKRKHAFDMSDLHRADEQQSHANHHYEDKVTMLTPNEDEEQVDDDREMAHRRMKRQVYYQSGYDGEKNCHGFPLEINVRSRIKMDRLFPIHGKSQFRKCVKVG